MLSRRAVALLALCQQSLAFAAPRARAQRTRSLRGDAVDGPVVLVGEGKFGDETAALAAASAAELGGRVHQFRGQGDALATLLGACGPRDVVHCVDGALTKADWRAVERADLSVWVRCVNEFGNDNVGEIFRENAAKTRYEVAACGPYADPDASDLASRAAWGGGAAEVARLARFGSAPRLARERVDLEAGHDTFFVSLTFDDYGEKEASDCVEALSKDAAVTALEFRCDLLRSTNPGNVLRELSRVRAASATSWRGGPAKVMFTVRSVSQAGAYPDDDAAGMEALLRLGLRAGVDWLDVEARTLSKKVCRELKAEAAKRGATLVLGSDHALGARTSHADAQKMMASIEAKTTCDAAKLVLDAAASDDVAAAAACAIDVPGKPPRVALALGDAGVASRVLCTRFLPATHELLPSAAAPGQISPKTALALRETLGVTRKRDYFVLLESDFGSRSPAMHNAAFQACGLPHAYGVLELPKDGGLADLASATAADFRALLAKQSFGGLSVTIPHKQLVQPFLDELTDAAEAIGAVNTVTPHPRTSAIDAVSLGGSRPVLVGDNTDWIGICATLEDALARRGARAATGKALVVGSGGTARAACYALTKGFARRTGAGFDLLVYARDVAKAEALAAAFGGEAVARLDGVAVDALVSTVPGDVGFVAPDGLLDNEPAVLDVAYKPAMTALLDQALARGCAVSQGASMLVKQGVAQFEQWTRRVAPEPAMRAAVFEGVDELEASRA